jgi:putative nucleotidyltransferase with HDIG domain
MLKNDHTLVHAAKVCLFSVLVGERLGLNEKDLLLLMTAAIFHDIGRVNNTDDARHGEKSVNKLKEYGFSVPGAVETIIRLHSRGDSLSKNEYLTRVFKDVDALDRVRTNDLDEHILRFEETKEFLKFSKEVNICLLKVIERQELI